MRWGAVGASCAIGLLVLWHAGYRFTAASRAVDVVGVGAPVASDYSGTLRVLAYNIAHGRGFAESNWRGGDAGARRERIGAIVSLLRSADADVVVLNEADFDASWSGGVDHAVEIARGAGYPYVARQRNFDVALPLFKLEFGNAVLSRFPISGARRVDLPAYRVWESVVGGQKHGLLVEIALPDGTGCSVFAVHFDSRDERTRVESALRLIEVCDSVDSPVIALGDFNASAPGAAGTRADGLGRNSIETILDSGALIPALDGPAHGAPYTFPSDAPARTLDWVFATPGVRATAFRAIETRLSDHLPVVADFEFVDASRRDPSTESETVPDPTP